MTSPLEVGSSGPSCIGCYDEGGTAPCSTFALPCSEA
jgi:hypothetical protein